MKPSWSINECSCGSESTIPIVHKKNCKSLTEWEQRRFDAIPKFKDTWTAETLLKYAEHTISHPDDVMLWKRGYVRSE